MFPYGDSTGEAAGLAEGPDGADDEGGAYGEGAYGEGAYDDGLDEDASYEDGPDEDDSVEGALPGPYDDGPGLGYRPRRRRRPLLTALVVVAAAVVVVGVIGIIKVRQDINPGGPPAPP